MEDDSSHGSKTGPKAQNGWLYFEQRLRGGAEQGFLSTISALTAYVPVQALGMKEGFWGAITAVAVLQTEFKATKSTARDQFSGAAIGGFVSIVVLFTHGESLTSYALAVFLSLLACWLMNVASAARLAGVTATIILLVPHATSAQSMLISRVSEVAWGISVSVAIVWLEERLKAAVRKLLERRRESRASIRRRPR